MFIETNRIQKIALVLFFAIGIVSANAQLTVAPDSLNISQDANALLTFSVAGGSNVNALQFVLQIGDGGSDMGGTDTKPTIQSVELVTDCIFSSGTQQEIVAYPLACMYSVDDSVNVITATGQIAKVSLNTSLLNIGDTFTIKMSDVSGQDTFFDYNGTPIGTTSGTFVMTVVPEPATMAILAIGCLSWACRRKHA